MDVKDFDFQSINHLSLQDGLATLSMLTVQSIIMAINSFAKYPNKILVSGGGRNNKFIIDNIKKNIKSPILLIDEFDFDGDLDTLPSNLENEDQWILAEFSNLLEKAKIGYS